MNMTAVEWLIIQIKNDHIQKALTGLEWMKIFDRAKEMEKEQLNIARVDGINLANKGYGSKESDNSPKVENKKSFGELSSQTEISDGAKQTADFIDKHIVESMKQLAKENFFKEISDNEIDIISIKMLPQIESSHRLDAFKLGMKMYREQLKNK